MQFRDIIVVLDERESCQMQLECAVRLARRVEGRLTGIGFAPPPPQDTQTLSAEWGTGAIEQLGPAAELDPDLQPGYPETATSGQAITNAENLFRAATEGIVTDWHSYEYQDTDRLIQMGQLADLVVLGQAPPRGESIGWVLHPDEVVLATGGPCLVIPYAGSFEEIGKRVLVAWDGSIEAARALRSARPFLSESSSVTIIGVYHHETAHDEMRTSLEQVELRLRTQGIKVEVESTIQGELKVSDILLNRAADLSADLLVAGSFHHSRLREMVVGGVSRELLTHMTLPVLMSH